MSIRSDLKLAAEAVMAMEYPWEHTIRDGRLGKTSTQYANLAHPSNVLGLIAEVERLQAAKATLERLGYTDNGGQLWKPPIGKKPDFDLIDQLKAENFDLHATLQAAKGEIERLKAENESLRKDAERYLFLRDGDDDLVAVISVGEDSITFVGGVHADKAVDAAMSKEASHD